MKEKCVLCNKETEYDESTPVYYRKYYVDSGGQLCKDCYEKVYDKK